MIEIFTIYFDDLYDKKTDRYLHLILTTTFFIKIVDLEQVQIEIKKNIFLQKKIF